MPPQSEVGEPGHKLCDTLGIFDRIPVGHEIQLRNTEGRIALRISDKLVGVTV